MGLLDKLFGKKSKGKKKTPSKKSTGKKESKSKGRKKSDVRKIYKTTDGYFTENPKIKKPRRVAVVKQRTDDGALAVCKIYSKEEKEGTRFVQNLTLSPKKHKSLTEDSIVGGNVIVGTKGKDKTYKPIQSRDLSPTRDKLTKKEHRRIMENLGGGIEKYKKTNEKLLEDWENHFKK